MFWLPVKTLILYFILDYIESDGSALLCAALRLYNPFLDFLRHV